MTNNIFNDPYIEKLRALKPKFTEMNIKRLRVFGSRVRGDARPDSDLDVLVEFIDPPSLLSWAGTQNNLRDALGIDVEICQPNSLHAALRKQILNEAIDV